jgi:hypothetical protein
MLYAGKFFPEILVLREKDIEFATMLKPLPKQAQAPGGEER